MGYTTEFSGSFELDRPLTDEHRAYLEKFNDTRRMARDATKAELLPDPVRLAAGLPVGEQGGYFVGAKGHAGQDHEASILDYNTAPKGQPGLWCQWQPTYDGAEIVWDEGEKFYNYVEWLEYIIAHFLQPWGYVLNGEVEWDGEDREDIGQICVKDNVVETKYGKVVYV
jgi:hypothetical protein